MSAPVSNTALAEAGCGAVPAGGAPEGGRDCALFEGRDAKGRARPVQRIAAAVVATVAVGLLPGAFPHSAAADSARSAPSAETSGPETSGPSEPVLPESGFSDLVLHDSIEEPGTWRYRFVLPDLGGPGREMEALSATMQALCERVVLPRIAGRAQDGDSVVVTLMDKPVEFGTTAPGTTQFFEAYRIEDTRCIWEFF